MEHAGGKAVCQRHQEQDTVATVDSGCVVCGGGRIYTGGRRPSCPTVIMRCESDGVTGTVRKELSGTECVI